MRKRIFRSVLAVAAIILVASILIITGVLHSHFTARHKEQIKSEALYIAEGINLSGQQYLENIANKSMNRITLFSSDGTVLFDSQSNGVDKNADTDSVKAALEHGYGDNEQYSKMLVRKTYHYSVLLDGGNVVRISSIQDSVLLLFIEILKPTVAVIAISLIFSAILSAQAAKNIIKPINDINLDNPIISNTDNNKYNDIYEEISPLLRRINSQSRQIDNQLRELQIRQQEFSAITENMREGFVIIDKNTNILSYNSSALHLFGADESEKQGVLKLRSSESFKEAAKTALNEKHNEDYISYDDRRYLLISNPVTTNNEVIGAIIIILDVTEKEERDNLRREFTANVSHELKTPLTSISGFAEILKNGMVRNEDVVRFSENIYNEAQRMIVLIGDIMRLSQLDENAIPIEKRPVDIYDVSKSVLERLSASANKKNVSLEIQGVHADIIGGVQILDEMIFNLADNAIKYNKPGGKVIISVSKGRGVVILSVEDTGIGIANSEKERVFERFYRVDKSHSKEIGGTGLGLSIVKHGAIYHNAKVELKSEPSKGTVVTLIFNVE